MNKITSQHKSQSKIDQFFKKTETLEKPKQTIKFKFKNKSASDNNNQVKNRNNTIVKALIKIDIDYANKLLEPLESVQRSIYDSYKKEKRNISLEKIKDHFIVLNDVRVKELLSLFERPIPTGPKARKYWRRIATEFTLIRDKNFFEVFKQVKEILTMTKEYPHVIRGSAGCSVICYLMKITDLDPIYLKIPLTRFMHERREDIPDIDIDFPALDRDKIFDMIYERWPKRVARISNHVLYKPKSAIKEAIRRNGYRKFIPRDFEVEDIFKDKKTIANVYSEADSLLGEFKNYSLHCGGIVIFEKEVPSDMILQSIANDKGKQLKMNKDQVEDAKYIKIDILSNRGLSQLWDISQMKIIDYPHDDMKVFDFFASGDNLGLTYGESRGMRKIFVEMKPKTIHDIAAALALIRPAAAKNGQKFNFLKTYHLPNKVNRNEFVIYDDDAIEYISKLLKISLSEADIYRKAFAKNRWKLKNEFKRKLREKRPDMTNEDIEFICEKLDGLQSYSFCKSHAYSYAYLLFALAYQKVYQPKKFWLATLKNCNTSYRSWTHYRAAINAGVNVREYIKKPIMGDLSLPKKQVIEYFANGFWSSKRFLSNMYLKFDKNIFIPIGVREERKLAVKCKFRGLIATTKVFKADSKIKAKESDSKKKRNRFVTFVTLGYDNDKMIDIVLWGCHKLSKVHSLSGVGVYEQNGHWIKVDKVEYSYL